MNHVNTHIRGRLNFGNEKIFSKLSWFIAFVVLSAQKLSLLFALLHSSEIITGGSLGDVSENPVT